MLDRRHHLRLRGAVARQLVRDHDTRGPALLFQQLAKQALGGPLVAPALDQNVEHDPILVDSPPEPVLRSPDHQAHFVQVPLVARAWQLAADLLAKRWPSLRAHCRTVSWLASMPRAASISSTMRRLSGKRK